MAGNNYKFAINTIEKMSGKSRKLTINFFKQQTQWLDGWINGWVGGLMEVKAVLRIAYSNQYI